MRSRNLFFTLSLSILLVSLVLAEEPLLDKVLQYKIPQGWRSEKGRERWLGPDPTVRLEGSKGGLIRVTHYGLEGSRLGTPETFKKRIDNLFSGESKEVEETSLSGKKAELIRLRYHYREFRDHDGRWVPSRFLLEEFLIRPLEKGFLVFNFTLSEDAPLPSMLLPEGESLSDRDREVITIIKEWRGFLESCNILE